MLPIAEAADKECFDRIGLDVIAVTLKVGIVADRMVPISSQPQATLPLGDARCPRHIDHSH